MITSLKLCDYSSTGSRVVWAEPEVTCSTGWQMTAGGPDRLDDRCCRSFDNSGKFETACISFIKLWVFRDWSNACDTRARGQHQDISNDAVTLIVCFNAVVGIGSAADDLSGGWCDDFISCQLKLLRRHSGWCRIGTGQGRNHGWKVGGQVSPGPYGCCAYGAGSDMSASAKMIALSHASWWWLDCLVCNVI